MTASQLVDDSLRVAPPIAVSTASFLGLGIEDWMYIATIMYTMLQGSYLIYRWRRSHKRSKYIRRRRRNNEQQKDD